MLEKATLSVADEGSFIAIALRRCFSDRKDDICSSFSSNHSRFYRFVTPWNSKAFLHRETASLEVFQFTAQITSETSRNIFLLEFRNVQLLERLLPSRPYLGQGLELSFGHNLCCTLILGSKNISYIFYYIPVKFSVISLFT